MTVDVTKTSIAVPVVVGGEDSMSVSKVVVTVVMAPNGGEPPPAKVLAMYLIEF